MNTSTRAYNELVGFLLTQEDRQKFEWSIGAMLSDAPPFTVVLFGDARTGKTTLTTIVRKILLSPFSGNTIPRAAFAENIDDSVGPHKYLYVEANYRFHLPESLRIELTGNRVPVNKHHVLMQEIDLELPTIIENCVEIYHSLREYFTFEENI